MDQCVINSSLLAMLTHRLLGFPVLARTVEHVVDPPGLGKDGAKYQGEGNAGNPDPQLQTTRKSCINNTQHSKAKNRREEKKNRKKRKRKKRNEENEKKRRE